MTAKRTPIQTVIMGSAPASLAAALETCDTIVRHAEHLRQVPELAAAVGRLAVVLASVNGRLLDAALSIDDTPAQCVLDLTITRGQAREQLAVCKALGETAEALITPR